MALREDGHRPMSSLKELQDLIQEKYGLDPAALDPHASMRDKGFDSLALVEFVFAVEDHFKISMPDQDVNIDTLAELAAVVDKTLAAQATPAQAK
jgi:acyl carrier protein